MKRDLQISSVIQLVVTPLTAGIFSLMLASNYGIRSFWYLAGISIILSLVVFIFVYSFDKSRHADNIFGSSSFGMLVAFIVLHFYPLGNWCVLSAFVTASYISYILLTILTFDEIKIKECNIVKHAMACDHDKF